MKLKWLLLFTVLCALSISAMAQDASTDYIFETGTTIMYPADWESEVVDGVLTLTSRNQSQVLVLDYPIIATLDEASDALTLLSAVEIVANLLLDTSIDATDIYEFTLDDRSFAAYDVNLALAGSIYATEFTNGAIGMMISIDVDDEIETDMLISYDNAQDVATTDVTVPTARGSAPRSMPTAFIFSSDQRFFVPADWRVELRQRDELQYAVITLDDVDIAIRLIDLSEFVTRGTDLVDVIEASALDWDDSFALDFDDSPEPYALGDREAIQYPAILEDAESVLIILRYTDGAVGAAIVSGDAATNYTTEIAQVVGSFNNLGAVINFLN